MKHIKASNEKMGACNIDLTKDISSQIHFLVSHIYMSIFNMSSLVLTLIMYICHVSFHIRILIKGFLTKPTFEFSRAFMSGRNVT